MLLFTLSGTDPLASVPGIAAGSTSDPVHAVFDGHGELFVGNRFSNDLANGSISRFLVRPDGTFKPNGAITGNGLQNVHGLAVSASGELFATPIVSSTFPSPSTSVPVARMATRVTSMAARVTRRATTAWTGAASCAAWPGRARGCSGRSRGAC